MHIFLKPTKLVIDAVLETQGTDCTRLSTSRPSSTRTADRVAATYSSKFLCSKTTSDLGCIFSQCLAGFFVGTLLPDIFPTEATRAFCSLEEPTSTTLDDVDNLHRNLWLITTPACQIPGLIFCNELPKNLIAWMVVRWSTTTTQHIVVSQVENGVGARSCNMLRWSLHVLHMRAPAGGRHMIPLSKVSVRILARGIVSKGIVPRRVISWRIVIGARV